MNMYEIRDLIGKEYLNRFEMIQEECTFVRSAYAEIAAVNRELFKKIPFKVVFTSEDSYSSAADMRKRVIEEQVIYIYDGWEGHPYLTLEDNLIGRAVHDVFAHMVCGCPFNFEGELSAYYEQRNYYPSWTWRVLFAEIPGQTAAYYANNHSHSFKQRAIVAPAMWMQLARTINLPDYSSFSVLSFDKKNNKNTLEVK